MHRKIIALFVLLASLLPAQQPGDAALPARPDFAKLDAEIAQALVVFARAARADKMPSRARKAFAIVVEHYDADNAAARRGLGYQRVKDEWQLAAPADKAPADSANAAQQKRVADAWRRLAQKCCRLHRDAGLALLARDEQALGAAQLERALSFDPDDVPSHEGLGHRKFEDFHGTEDEIAFARRMRALFDKANELAATEHEVTALPAERLPNELRNNGLAWHGARSANFRVWVVGSAEAAAQIAVWQERALAFMRHVCDPGVQRLLRVRIGAFGYLAVVRTAEERDRMLANAPAMYEGYTLDQARVFGGRAFDSTGGLSAWARHDETGDADHAVGHFVKTYVMNGRSPGLGEGLVHASTWLLCGSVLTRYMNLPHTVGSGYEPMGHDPEAWLERLQDEIDSGEDCPLVQVPRERMDNFRDSTRLKSWSFMIWLLARHPEQWGAFVDAVSDPQVSPERIGAAIEQTLGSSLAEVEEAWRRWARRDSRLGRVTGFSR
jgi:hypothetical protein